MTNSFSITATIQHGLTGDDLETGHSVPATGLTVTAMIADHSTATAPIHADLQKTLGEVAGTGEYLGTISGEAITARLTSYLGQKVFEIVSDGASLQLVAALRVSSVRLTS